jgi:tetratricopeptide (TPR) repeat protein
MTEPETPESLPKDGKSSVSAPEAELEVAEPEPEPWTPARVTEWNAYYDLYVAIGVILLVFAVSANEITHSALWTWLQAGRTMAAQHRPLVTDSFSYTAANERWVNVAWLFEWSHALIHDGVVKAAPSNPVDPIGSRAKAEQFGAAALVALTALARTATLCLLLLIRRPGPGLWWSSVAAAMALGAFPGPTGLALGGIAGTALVAPETWGTLLLALELYLWHRAVDRGEPLHTWWLVPLFLAWANVDDSFLTGLLVLAAGVGGLGAPSSAPRALPLTRGLVLLGTCVLVCLINPSFFRIFPAACERLAYPFQVSPLLPWRITPKLSDPVCWAILLIYMGSVALGIGSFLLNRRRFSLSRCLIFAFAALLWGAFIAARAEFAVILAATLAMNGQEWYHDRFGTVGRIERGWGAWSVGGRAVTIIVVFTCVAMALTGWGKSQGDPIFGFGYDPDSFAFEVADFLRGARIEGRVLNTTREQGDALVWRAYPERQTFIDSRRHLFPAAVVDHLQKTRVALSKDDKAVWKPLLDEFRITAVMIDEPNSPKTYQRLLQSPNWIPFYDDGSVVLFGRADAPEADLAFFRARQLKAQTLAFVQPRPVPPPESTPLPTTWVDWVYRNRSLREPQPHNAAALHWLATQGVEDLSETGRLPDPAHCYMAIHEARIALANRADDSGPYRILSEAYRLLMLHESALLAGVKLSPENADAILQVEPRTGLLMNRFRQRAAALNAAILTAPPPRTEPDRQALFTLNYQLYQLFMSVNYIDLARDRLQAMVAQMPKDVNAEMATGLTQQLAALNQQVKAIQDELTDQTLEHQLNPLQRAALARSRGAPGLAMVELEEADRTGLSPAIARPQLVDLYCDTGQPEKAQELLGSSPMEDTTLDSAPGAAAARQARVNYLLGFYESAERLWQDQAITRLRFDRAVRALNQTVTLIRGQPDAATRTVLEIPGRVELQAAWEYDLGLSLLEGGRPDLAGGPLDQALTLAPDFALRPVAAYYLEKLGKPVPPPSASPKAEEAGKK